MNTKLLFLFFIFYFLLPIYSFAQQKDSVQTDSILYKTSLKSKHIFSKKDTLSLDSLLILPYTVQIKSNNKIIADTFYKIENNRLIWLKKRPDSVQISYRVLPYPITNTAQHKDRALIGNTLNGKETLIGYGSKYNPYGNNKNLEALDFKGLDYSGNFSRGISVGNKQDLILNSNFNLQLAGKIGDVEITGAISDNNIPVQPDGNTQQLQDFDKIFIQFKVQNHTLIAGDYNLAKPKDAYFLNYQRRLQGGQLNNVFNIGKQAKLETNTSFAVSRGKFARNIFNGIEGNQGPYKLTGNNGERFIIILAGTERVFIDGILLTRGADNDYVIDYNLGEIRFTNKQLITKDKRIQVEITYSDLNFVRTLFNFNAKLEYKNLALRFQYYSEQDAKNQSAQQNLSDTTTRTLLENIGDSIQLAYTRSIKEVTRTASSSNQLLYKMMDTLVNNVLYDSVLVYLPADTMAKYVVQFTAVSNGGNYIRLQDGSNGAIYRWSAPDSLGHSTGTHAPISLIITPKRQQVTNIGVDYKLGKTGLLQADLCLSNYDVNTYSKLGNQDNTALATRITYQDKILLGKSENGKGARNELNLGGHYEYVQQHFEQVEPYRAREFQRDWNINNVAKTNEHWAKWNAGISNIKWGKVQYEGSLLYKDSLYNGLKNSLIANINYKGFRLNGTASYLKTQAIGEKTDFLRPKIDISYTIKKAANLQIGVYGEQEKNQRWNTLSDTLQKTSFYFNIVKVYAQIPSSDKKFKFSTHWQRRYDYTADSVLFKNNAIADEINASGEWNVKTISQLQWNLSYRNLQIPDTNITILRPQETYLGRLEYNLNVKRGFIKLNTIYELGSGQQQKIEYNYVKVDKGIGTHVWVDRNDDKIQQQNEFELAPYPDVSEYVRVTVLTNQFIRSHNVTFSQSLDITPKVLLTNSRNKTKPTKFIEFLGKLSARSVAKIERKTLFGADVIPYNPFQVNVADTSLVSLTTNLQNSIFFNRASPKFSMEFNQLDSRSKTLLSIGFETRTKSEYQFINRIKISKSFISTIQGSLGSKGNSSQFFPERTYFIHFYNTEPQISYMYKTIFRIQTKYAFKYQNNTLGQKETVQSHTLGLELTYSKASKTNIRTQFSIVNLKYVGANNTPIQFAMTEGLRNGQNFLWSISLDRAISQNIQLTISYEGRKTGTGAAIVHLGRAQIRATF